MKHKIMLFQDVEIEKERQMMLHMNEDNVKIAKKFISSSGKGNSCGKED